jgi:hypothetical protein
VLLLNSHQNARQSNAMFYGIPMPISDSHPDYVPLMLGNHMLGGALNSRLCYAYSSKTDCFTPLVHNWAFGSRRERNILTYAMALENAAKLEIGTKKN